MLRGCSQWGTPADRICFHKLSFVCFTRKYLAIIVLHLCCCTPWYPENEQSWCVYQHQDLQWQQRTFFFLLPASSPIFSQRCCPKFTFPTFTPDPNLHTPHIYTRPKFTQTQIYTRPKFTQTQIYTNPFLDIYFNKPKFTQPKFTQNPNLHNPNLRNPNLHKTQIYTTQIYTKLKKNTILLSKFTQNWTQIYTDPNLHRPKFTLQKG